MSWTKIAAKGEVPSDRQQTTLACVQNTGEQPANLFCLVDRLNDPLEKKKKGNIFQLSDLFIVYLYGGTKRNETFPDMFTLDVGTWTWKKLPTTGDKPIVWGYLF
jgi:hypothetical protein